MKKNFFITPIGRAIFTTEETKHQRTDKAFNAVVIASVVLLVVVQIIKAV
jgi:H+/Cl- antiporter ClcA